MRYLNYTKCFKAPKTTTYLVSKSEKAFLISTFRLSFGSISRFIITILAFAMFPQFLWLLASPANMQTNCFQFASPQTSVIIERLKQWFYWQIKASYTAIIGLNETPRNLIQYYQLCLSAKGRGRMELSRSIRFGPRFSEMRLVNYTVFFSIYPASLDS